MGAAIGAGMRGGLKARLMEKVMVSRRRLGTGAAICVAVVLAYHVVAGNNGLTIYKQKMAEDKQLAKEVQVMQAENDRLKKHVDHLAADPDAIEYEAHRILHYARPGQVIVLNDQDAPSHAE